MTGHPAQPVQYATTNPDGSVDTVLVYRDAGRLWRWKRTAGNNRIVGDSGQGYTRKDSAVRAARSRHPQTGHRQGDRTPPHPAEELTR